MIRHLLTAMVALAAACTPQRQTSAPLPAVDGSRISHLQHAQVGCGECHPSAARPGANDHRPCDNDACHRKDFTGEPTRLCQVCHQAITAQPLRAPLAPLKPYPVVDPWQAEPSKFSHQRHLDAARMESRVGFHVSCNDCHTRGEAGLTRPDHAACARCHAAEVGLTSAPRMEECRACHQPTTRQRSRPRLIRDDLHFDHARHRTDRGGRVIRCEDCHTDTAGAAEYRDHAPPRVESCVVCHDDSARTPPIMRMRICETCHKLRSETLASLAPRSHLPATEQPLDHTLAFRRDHTGAAERDATRCAACHTQMSGNPRQACDECHQTMVPSDHRITWREFDHGSESAADRERCARCHVVDFCSACHRQRPRSHGFASAFWTDHGRSARVVVRRCVTCHVESFCAQCHTAATPRGVR